MKPAFILLVIVGLVSQFNMVESKDEIRDTPRLWCGANPPYMGTLFHAEVYGFPLPAFEVVYHESCTTMPNERMQMIPSGVVVNFALFSSLWILFNSTLFTIREKEDI